ncbi:hypothetical protein ACMA1D_06950 [Streptomyces sp. 796.1]|uniref:hypothetical protein n=1 Tax=Streptomyces sp. 796.1 TaxID=3163029 RepID=UPI0039C918A7
MNPADPASAPRDVWVFLLIRCAGEAGKHFDAVGMWPRVLQVVKDGWGCPPGVVLRPGEAIESAAERVADALGIRLPESPALLAVDQQPAIDGGPDEELAFVVDGGAAEENAFQGLPRHEVDIEWSAVEDLERVALVHALRTRLLAVETPLLVEGMPRTPRK